MKLTDGRKLSKEAQLEIRMRVIEHWQKHGNMAQAGTLFGIPYITVRKWVNKFNNEGIGSIKSDQRGRPEGKELNKTQEDKIIRKLIDKTPDQLKLRFGLWTRESVSELIWREYGIRRSVWQIGRYLKEWGFTPQKPVYQFYEQNNEVVKEWLTKVYPKIKIKAQRDRATIFWGDETGIWSKDTRGRSFAPKGKTPRILKTGKQFGITMISAITNRGKLYFMFHKGGVNSEVFLKFLVKLIKNQKNKIYLIVDNFPSHKTKKIKYWLEQNKKKIELFYLPPYSPELNPDEYLNQDLKANITGKISMTTSDELKKGVRNFMNKRKRNPLQIKKYFHHNKVKYAA